VLIGLGLFGVLALLWSAPPGIVRGAGGTIAVGDVRPGMKGYGLTVFRGTQPERFDVEVIDVLDNFRPDQDLILVRTYHPVLEKAIVVGGMSGSPIYLEGKLAGAYAYGWLFGKEPVAGVTPIANMLAEMVRPVDPAIWKALGTLPQQLGAGVPESAPQTRARPSAGLPPYLGRERTDALTPLRQHAVAQGYAPAGDASPARSSDGQRGRPTAALVPAATPLMLSGLDDRVSELLGSELERFGLVALQAGGGQRRPKPAARAERPQFVDGGSLGVQLIRGDINATAIGTVTHVSGDRLVGFGHPMMNAGQPALPTSTAKVVHVFASEQRSFKIAESIAPLGTMIHDRQAGVVIDTRLQADTVPLRVRVRGVTGAPRTEWNMQLASQRMITPLLALSSMFNALSVTAAERADVVFAARSRVRVQDHGTVELVDFGYTPIGFANPLALAQLRMFDVIAAAYGNPFEDARIEGIDVELDVRFERDVVTIIDALVGSTEVDPDSDVNVYVTLQRFAQPEQVRIVPVHIPASAAGEKVEIAFEPGNTVQLERPEPTTLEQILDNVRMGYPATSMVVSTKLPGHGLRLRGHVVSDLPGSALDMLQLAGDSARPQPFAAQARTELPMERVVLGSARVTLEVRREPLR
jgi:SpoIVB peptidase S55